MNLHVKLIGAVGIAVIAVCAMAQEKTGLTKSRPKSVVKVVDYVTQGDALAVFQKAEKLLRNTTKSTAKAPPITLKGSELITREQTIQQLVRLYEIVRPKVKLTPKPVKMNPAVLSMKSPEKAQLIKLVRMGAVGNYGPLAAGPANKLTVAEFGDALGFFLARMAEMTHMPSPKWSPPLMGSG